eukprot:gene6849-7067_t
MPRSASTNTQLLASGSMALLCVHLMLLLPLALGQGLELSKGGLGATYKAEAILGQRYARVKSVRQNFRSLKTAGSSAATKCGAGSGALCASNLADDQQLLQMAASPDVFDARSAFPSKAISPPGDQGKCNSCVGFAVAAAASAAVATVLQIDGDKVQLSVQDLQFCNRIGSSATPARTCKSSWNYVAALNRLAQSPMPVKQDCLPYTAANDVKFSQLCNYCNLPAARQVNEYAAAGTFLYEPVTDLVDVQKAIRTYGGVLTAINVDIQHMRAFFQKQPRGIYSGSQPAAGSDEFIGHAIFVVGYSNKGRYWIVKNSFGEGFADGGFMRIAYGSMGIMPPDQTFVVLWAPGPQSPRQQPPLPVTRDPTRTGCYRYTAQRTDFLSRIAAAAGVDLATFIKDNVKYISELDQQLSGLNLLICNPPDPTLIKATYKPAGEWGLAPSNDVPAPAQASAPVVTSSYVLSDDTGGAPPLVAVPDWTPAIVKHTGGFAVTQTLSPQDVPDIIQGGGCGYGTLTRAEFPMFSLAGAGARSLFSGRPLQGCGTCMEVRCNAGEVPCTFSSPIAINVDQYRPTAGGWIRLSVRNVAGDGSVTGVQLGKDGAWLPMKNTAGARWEASKLPNPPFDLLIESGSRSIRLK